MLNPRNFPKKDLPTKELQWSGLGVSRGGLLAFLALNLRDTKYAQSELRSGYSAYSLVTLTLAQFLHLQQASELSLGDTVVYKDLSSQLF